jgi:hypothetical protein
MKCVPKCEGIEITGEQIGNFKVCRKFEYYVDPESASDVELGTREYPYK